MTFQFHQWRNPPPPPHRKLKFRHFLAFYDFSILTSGEYHPLPPWKLKFRHFLAFYDFSILTCGEYPPPPWKLKFRHFLAFYDFSILTCGEYPPPPPENWNLGISWHFMTFQFWPVENTPLPPWKFKFRHFLAFYDFSILTCGEYTPPPENWNLGISWHFKTFQFWPVEKTAPPPPTPHPPTPRKLKFRHFLAFYDFSILTSGEYTPPPKKKLKFRHFLAFYDFSILTSGEYTPLPPKKIGI